MVKKVGHFFKVSYPAFIFAAAILTWSSTHVAEVAHLIPPPVGDGFVTWAPVISKTQSCKQKESKDFLSRQACSISLSEKL